jgi:hypothetical protein
MRTSARTSTDDKPSIQALLPRQQQHRTDADPQLQPIPKKSLLEYHNTEHDYKVLKVKQRIKEENEMLQNEMTRLREIRKNHRLQDYGANVQNMKNRIDEYKRLLRSGDVRD